MIILAIDPGSEKSAYYRQAGKYGAKKEDGLTASQRYYRRHRAQKILDAKKYQEQHKKELSLYMREYRKKKPEIMKAIENKRIRPSSHKEKFNQYCKKWKKNNPDKRLASYQKRRALINGGFISADELIKLRNSQKGICFYCLKPLDNNGRGHLDHKIPISRGGKHEIDNVVFSCSTCNLKKSTKTSEEFLNDNISN